jgi:hypothetical protein
VYLSRTGAWRLPLLAGVTTTPFLRSDGSICEVPGYDAASGLLYKPNETFPPVPANPDQEARIALEALCAPIRKFPFETENDRAVALSGQLTELCRRVLPASPLHAYTAPAAGTGKSLLVDISSILATGKIMPVISTGGSEEELEKRLGAALLAADTGISIDNIEHPLQSAFLCQALTQQVMKIRVLGLSRIIETPVNSAIHATGNNLIIEGDLCRRTLLCSMDANEERPELRKFDFNALELVRAQRPMLVIAGLTILRAYRLSQARSAGGIGRDPIGSFEMWSSWVRDALIWAGCKGDPCATIAKVQAENPKRNELEPVLAQWMKHIGKGSVVTTEQVATKAEEVAGMIPTNPPTLVHDGEFYNSLLMATKERGGKVSRGKLTRWLDRNKSKVIGGQRIIKEDTKMHGYWQWRLE